jgi:hypothetical protein
MKFRSVVLGTVAFAVAGALVRLSMELVRLYRSLPGGASELPEVEMGF